MLQDISSEPSPTDSTFLHGLDYVDYRGQVHLGRLELYGINVFGMSGIEEVQISQGEDSQSEISKKQTQGGKPEIKCWIAQAPVLERGGVVIAKEVSRELHPESEGLRKWSAQNLR